MATIDASPESSLQPPAAPAPTPAPTGLIAGDPMSIGLPAFLVGSIALGLVDVGQVPATAVGASLAIILSATAIGLLVAAIWAIAVGQSAVACVFGVFSGFWLSYAVFVLGLFHNWFAIGATDIKSSTELFLTAWLIFIVLLTVATLRLPLAFTAILALVDLTLVLLLIATIQGSSGLQKVAGVVIFVFCAIGAYVFASVAATATGGAALPLGNPVIR